MSDQGLSPELIGRYSFPFTKKLIDEFGNRVAFCGRVDAQVLMVNGTPAECAQIAMSNRNPTRTNHRKLTPAAV